MRGAHHDTVSKITNVQQSTDREPSRQPDGSGRSCVVLIRSAAECVGGLKYLEAWSRVHGRCEPRTARGPMPMFRCAQLILLLVLRGGFRGVAGASNPICGSLSVQFEAQKVLAAKPGQQAYPR